MRRLLRHALTIWSAISLVLCVAVCVLWVRSYRTHDMFDRIVGDTCWGVSSNRGVISFVIEGPPSPRRAPDTGWLAVRADPGDWVPVRHRFAGVGWGLGKIAGVRCRTLVVPTGYMAALLVLPALVLVARGRLSSRPARRGLCRSCGYDLRAHAKGERCPECGMAVA